MFGLNIRFQIAAISVLLIIIVDYLHNPHLKLLSNKYFKALLLVISINLGLDIGTVYTITHMDSVPAWVNRFVHQLFIASIILGLFYNYLYVTVLSNNQKRMEIKKRMLTSIPLVIAAIMIIFGDLNYYVHEDGIYSYGIMAASIYACGIVYFILIFKMCLDKKNMLTNQQRKSIRVGLVIWILALGIQTLWPTLLLSALGFVLMVLSVYFSFENQKENFDVETKCFNRNAFHKMMAEYYEDGKTLYLVNVVCENYQRINSLLGHDKGTEALIFLKDEINHYLNKEVYHSRSNVFSIFINTDFESERSEIENLAYALSQSNFNEMKFTCYINVMDIRKFTNNKDEVYELINFMSNNLLSEGEKIHYLNEEIVQKKQRHDQIDKILSNAIKNDGFEMYYQPIYWPSEKKIRSAEALIRLKKIPDIGYISPEEFIPIAEEKGLIMEIGDRVIEMVAEFIEEHSLEESGLKYIEVNLSGIQATSPDIDKRLMNILKKYGVSPSFINLEITETATVNTGKSFTENMEKLRKLGFSFSMDDFGTGYSNLAQVSQISYDLVKIDKSLIWPAFEKENKKAADLLNSVISMMKRLNIAMVAEGVETQEMADFLAEKGVAHLQGYYFSKPVDKKAFLSLFVI